MILMKRYNIVKKNQSSLMKDVCMTILKITFFHTKQWFHSWLEMGKANQKGVLRN